MNRGCIKGCIPYQYHGPYTFTIWFQLLDSGVEWTVTSAFCHQQLLIEVLQDHFPNMEFSEYAPILVGAELAVC